MENRKLARLILDATRKSADTFVPSLPSSGEETAKSEGAKQGTLSPIAAREIQRRDSKPVHSHRDEAADEAFFGALADGLSVTEASREAGYLRKAVYRFRDNDANFAVRWVEALQMSFDLVMEEIERRGRDGLEEPVFYKGRVVGLRRRYSDRLLLARLAAGCPKIPAHLL